MTLTFSEHARVGLAHVTTSNFSTHVIESACRVREEVRLARRVVFNAQAYVISFFCCHLLVLEAANLTT